MNLDAMRCVKLTYMKHRRPTKANLLFSFIIDEHIPVERVKRCPLQFASEKNHLWGAVILCEKNLGKEFRYDGATVGPKYANINC